MNAPSWIGKTLGGRYQIEQLLGQGGMSAVYRGNDPNLRRAVAIKLIHAHLSSDPRFLHRFEEEAAAVAQLRHANIIQVFDFNQDEGTYYMVMEFVPGETLQDRLRRYNQSRRYIPLDQTARYISQIAGAVDYAHRRGMIHRDIKPANIMLDVHDQAILMDFGIARMVGAEKFTATGAVVGTALYMPPEVIRGELADARSDIYSLGVTLHEMICGKPPFEANSAMTLMMMHLNDPAPDLTSQRPDTPLELARIVMRALAKDPNQRFASAAEMSAALQALLPYLAGLPNLPGLVNQTDPREASAGQSAGPSAAQPAATRQPAAERQPAPTEIEQPTRSAGQPDQAKTARTEVENIQPGPTQPEPGGRSESEVQTRAALPAAAEATQVENPGHRAAGSAAQVGKPTPVKPLAGLPPNPPGSRPFALNPKVLGAGLAGLALVVILGILLAVGLPLLQGANRAASTNAAFTASAVAQAAVETAVPTQGAASLAQTSAPSDTPEPTATASPTVTQTPPPSATPTPSPTFTPSATPTPDLFVLIKSIRIENGAYVVDYETFGYREALPGRHVHFFFDTVAPENAGMPGSGPWILYGGPRPFKEYALSARPAQASQMCALVANADHSIILNSGVCMALP